MNTVIGLGNGNFQLEYLRKRSNATFDSQYSNDQLAHELYSSCNPHKILILYNNKTANK